MQRFDFFFRQKVSQQELDAAFDAVETFENNLFLDQGLVGIQSGADVTENAGTPNLTVDISGPSVIRDQLGQRINWTGQQDVDVSVDESSSSTAVGSAGNEKWLSIFAKFVRSKSDPRIDGDGSTVFYDLAESFEINVVQGAEAASGTATKPPLRADEVLLCDILIDFGKTQILNADINTDRREDAFVITDGSTEVRAGTAEEAIEKVAQSFSLDDVLHKSGAETASGTKTFSGSPGIIATGAPGVQLGAAGSIIDATALDGSGVPDAIFRDVNRAPSGSGATTVLHKIAEFLSAETDGANTARIRRFWSPDGSLITTFNCDYDNATNEWVSDANLAAYKYAEGGGLLSGGPSASPLDVQRRTVASAGERWDDTSWTSAVLSGAFVSSGGFFTGTNFNVEDGRIQFPNATFTGSNPNTSENPGLNALYAKSIPKAWGKVEVNAGTVTLEEGFGVSAAAANGTEFDVTFHNNFNNANYAVVSQPWYDSGVGAVLVAHPTNLGTGSMTLELRRADTGATVSIASALFFFHFHVYGEQQ